MIIYYHCTSSDNALLLSFLLTCHPYIPFHFMKWFLYLYYYTSLNREPWKWCHFLTNHVTVKEGMAAVCTRSRYCAREIRNPLYPFSCLWNEMIFTLVICGVADCGFVMWLVLGSFLIGGSKAWFVGLILRVCVCACAWGLVEKELNRESVVLVTACDPKTEHSTIINHNLETEVNETEIEVNLHEIHQIGVDTVTYVMLLSCVKLQTELGVYV